VIQNVEKNLKRDPRWAADGGVVKFVGVNSVKDRDYQPEGTGLTLDLLLNLEKKGKDYE